MPDWYKERFEDEKESKVEVKEEPSSISEFGFLDPLKGFKAMNIEIVPITEDFEKLAARKKFKEFFDVVVLAFINIDYLSKPEFKNIINKESAVFVEKTK